jgi:hypothetical protein
MKANTQKQLNIRSDSAYETAHRLARKLGKTTQQVVVEALEEKAKAMGDETPFTSEEIDRRRAAIDAAIDKLWGGRQPPPFDPSLDDWMYDENGLPR